MGMGTKENKLVISTLVNFNINSHVPIESHFTTPRVLNVTLNSNIVITISFSHSMILEYTNTFL